MQILKQGLFIQNAHKPFKFAHISLKNAHMRPKFAHKTPDFKHIKNLSERTH